jgi:hypothetical protein
MDNTLSDRLKALGVKIGAQDLPPPRPKPVETIEHILPGETRRTIYGETYLIRETYPPQATYGSAALWGSAPPELMAAWAGEPSLADCPPESFVFLDTETTGLSGDSGVYAFLVGVGRFSAGEFQLVQYFLREPGEETAMLAALVEYLEGCQVTVTFNGRAFDIPLLNGRFRHHKIISPLADYHHIDLYPLSRRLWRRRLAYQTLLYLEAQILGAARTREDVPGWIIPQLYFDYLQTGDARLIKNVFYHNARDVLAMAGLLSHLGVMLAQPLERPETPALDLISIAALYESLGRTEQAIQTYRASLAHDLPAESHWEVHRRLSGLLKKTGQWEAAVALWTPAAQAGQLFALLELAKYCEHRSGDLQAARAWTQSALELAGPLSLDPTTVAELEHRLQRLQRKLGAV